MTDFPDWTGPDAPDIASLPHLTALEAFDAMRVFIENHWERGLKKSDELRWLLSAMNRETAIWQCEQCRFDALTCSMSSHCESLLVTRLGAEPFAFW